MTKVRSKITDPKYQEYYFALKKLYELHRKHCFGKSPDIPSGFSEELCRFLLGATNGQDRTHDAITVDGKFLEIKATGSPQGKTTISNANKFDILAWLYIDFDSNTVYIYQLERSLFSLSGDKKRSSISLRGIAMDAGIQPTIYGFHD